MLLATHGWHTTERNINDVLSLHAARLVRRRPSGKKAVENSVEALSVFHSCGAWSKGSRTRFFQCHRNLAYHYGRQEALERTTTTKLD